MQIHRIDQELTRILGDTWERADALRQARLIAELLPDPNISWDEGDEDWIQVLNGVAVICYIHVRRPFVMLLSKSEKTVHGVIEGRVVALVVDSWTERCLSADLIALRAAFPGYILPDALPGRSVEAFSAEDLWFATD